MTWGRKTWWSRVLDEGLCTFFGESLCFRGPKIGRLSSVVHRAFCVLAQLQYSRVTSYVMNRYVCRSKSLITLCRVQAATLLSCTSNRSFVMNLFYKYLILNLVQTYTEIIVRSLCLYIFNAWLNFFIN